MSTGATRELNLGGPLALENEADTGAVPMMRNAELVEVKGELKKINKQRSESTRLNSSHITRSRMPSSA